MTGKRKRSGIARNAMIVALIVILFVVIAASYKGQVKQKYESSEYFEIYDAGYFPPTGNGSTIQIQTLGFYIRAVMGDAHNVNIRCGNMPSPELVPPDGTILKGESAFSGEIYPNIIYPALGVGKEFPIEIGIECTEASGEITIFLKQW